MVDTFNRLQGALAGLATKRPCRAATTGNVTLSGYQTIDNVTFLSGDEAAGYNMRVLVRAQTDSKQNGIYLANSGSWTREKDFDGNTDFCKGTLVFVTDGSTYGRTFFQVTSADPQSVGDAAITFLAIASVTYPGFTGASAGVAGATGLVPAPAAGQQTYFLRGDAVWAQVTVSAGQVSGLATIATSGSYSDLTGKPTFATVATTGSYNDLGSRPGAFTGDSGLGGAQGFVPAPSAGDGAAGKVLYATGSWATPPGASGGEANTASNINSGGVGVFKQKSGVNLEFKGINAASASLSVSNNAGAGTVDIDAAKGASSDVTAGVSTTLLITCKALADAGITLTSPAFSGTPTAPTAAAGTNTTQLATTSFVAAAAPPSIPHAFYGGI